MKSLKYSFAVVMVSLVLNGCKKDNYDEPSSHLSGRFMFEGEPVGVEFDRVPYDLFEFGFGKVGPIASTVTPEGSYSHVLFDGDYKLVVRSGQGPWLWGNTGGKPDTITIQVRGNTVRDIEVRPYYMIRQPQMAHSAGKVTANFSIEQTLTGPDAKNIDRAAIFISRTAFVGDGNNIAKTEIGGGAIADPNNVSLEVSIPNISPAQNYVFARIGVKASGVEDWVFSPVQKISF